MTQLETGTGRIHSHEGTVLMVAAHLLGVAMRPEDETYIRASAKLAAVVDDMFDNEGLRPNMSCLIAQPLDYVGNRLASGDRQVVARAMSSLSARHEAAWFRASLLPQSAEAKRAARSVQELSDALTEEARIFADIFSLDYPNVADLESRQQYNAWVWHFSRGGYHVDQGTDMPTDYREGRITVPPSLRNRKALFGTAFSELNAALKLSKSPALLWQLGKTAAATLAEGRRADISVQPG